MINYKTILKLTFMKTQMTKTLKMVITILCLWTFLHTFLLLRNIDSKYAYRVLFSEGDTNPLRIQRFYPFTGTIIFYDYTEYFVYVGGAWMLFFLYRLLKDK